MQEHMCTFSSVVLGIALVVGTGCSSKAAPTPSKSAAPASVKSAAPSASATASVKKGPPAPPPIDVSQEMKDFVAAVTEDHKLADALTKFAAPSLDEHGLGRDPLDSPRVVGTDHSAGDCYVLEGMDGPATHDYLICWQSGQIIQIADQGMK